MSFMLYAYDALMMNYDVWRMMYDDMYELDDDVLWCFMMFYDDYDMLMMMMMHVNMMM